jgi:LysR family hydrogen peroxide-inducible transcriptional activator
MTRTHLTGLSLRDLEYAVTVAQARHFGRAAQICGVSQPSLSEQVRKLEDLLGIRLFERAARRVQPTLQGERLLNQAERVLTEARHLLAMAQQHVEPLTGELALGAISTLAPYYLPHLLRNVRSALPRLTLRLSEQQTAALLSALRGGHIDAALLAMPVPSEGMASELVFYEPFSLVCPAGHRLLSQPSVNLSDLVDDDLILLEEGHCLRDQALSLCRLARPGSRQATSLETLWHMIASGEGFSLLPALSLCWREGMADFVGTRSLPEGESGRTIALVYRNSDPRAAEFKTLANVLRCNLPEGVEKRS